MREIEMMVLLVEPDPDLRSALRELLEIFGYRVLATANGEHAVQCYAQNPARIDALVAAAFMPRITGIELVDALRKLGGPLPALLLSVFGADLSLQRRVSSGDVGFLSVPFTADSFKRKLNEIFKLAPVEVNDGEQALKPACRRS